MIEAITNEGLEYAYTQRNEFTSEVFKIEVGNLGIFGIGELKKLLKNKLSLDFSKIKLPGRRDTAFICFRNAEEQSKAVTLLDGYSWKGRKLKAFKAKATADPLIKRRLAGEIDNENKKRKTCAEATCPLSFLPYQDQLEQKKKEMEEVLQGFGKQLSKVNPLARKLMSRNADKLPCEFLGIKPSPKINDYRNKCEFAIGKNMNGEITVGFRLGSYADGSVEVGEIDLLPHLPKNTKKAARIFEEFIKSTKLEVFNPEHNSGHFRQLSVRTSEANDDIMLIAGIYAQNLTETEVSELKTQLKAFFENYDKSIFDCTSLYYQDLSRREAGQMSNPVDHLLGSTHIFDEIHGLKFRISPLSFFQVNTKGADVLYQQVIDLASPKPHTTVLDICCGAGTIGLCFSKHCKEVLGVEICPDAIKDAEYNACNNAVTNCKFGVGNADDHIGAMVKDVYYSCPNRNELDIVAVVDPPRAGLHNRSILAIRSAKGLERLVYVSCHPRSAKQNWIDLARPESKTYKGDPFLPKVAMAVDMFPHTSHTELVVLFERANHFNKKPDECNKPVEVEQKNSLEEMESNSNDVSVNTENKDARISVQTSNDVLESADQS